MKKNQSSVKSEYNLGNIPGEIRVALDVTRLKKTNFIGGVQQVVWDAIETQSISEFVSFNNESKTWGRVELAEIQRLGKNLSKTRSKFRLKAGVVIYALNRHIPILLNSTEWFIKKLIAIRRGTQTIILKPCSLHGASCPTEIRFLLLDIPIDSEEINALFDIKNNSNCQSDFKKIAYVHDLMPLTAPEFVDSDSVEELQVKFAGYLSLIAKFEGVVANSHFTARELEEFNELKSKSVRVVYPAVPNSLLLRSSRYNQNRLERKPIFLAIGPWTDRKRFYLVFEALEKLIERGIDFELRVRRTNSTTLNYRTLKAFERLRKKIPRRVVLLNYLTPGDLEEEYFAARVVAIPSAYEGFGLPVLQATIAGATVVCSENSALAEVGAMAGAIFVSRDEPDEWAEKLLDALTSIPTGLPTSNLHPNSFVLQLINDPLNSSSL